MRLKGPLLAGLASALLFSSCHDVMRPMNAGYFQIAIAWPQNFQIQAIPPETERIELRLSGGAGNGQITRSLSRGESTAQQRFVLNTGNWEVQVKALGGQPEKILAEANEKVEIREGLTTRADIELKEILDEPQAEPEEGTGNSSSNNSGNPSTDSDKPNPTGETGETSGENGNNGTGTGENGQTPNETGTNETPDAPDTPQDNRGQILAPTPINGGNSGGGSAPIPPANGNNTNGPSLTAVEALPTVLSGLGYSTELRATVNDPNSETTATQYSWSCTDANGTTGCGSFAVGTSGRQAIWKSPNSSNGGANNQDNYTLTVTLNPGSAASSTQSVTVTVNYGTGTAGSGPAATDGGQ